LFVGLWNKTTWSLEREREGEGGSKRKQLGAGSRGRELVSNNLVAHPVEGTASS
jgi:hypothetical protein